MNQVPNIRKTISFVGDTDLQRWLNQQALTQDRSVSAVIRRIIGDARQRQQATNIKTQPNQ